MSARRKSAPSPIVQQPVAQSYARFLAGIKERIRTAQVKAALAANAELVLHYWEIGGDILANQARQGLGAKVIDRLAADLQRDFPKLSGYSVRNLKYMRAFAESWPDRPIVHQLAAQIPWGHNCVLLDRVRNADARAFYIRHTIQHGWPEAFLFIRSTLNFTNARGSLRPTSPALSPRPNPISPGRCSKILTFFNRPRWMNLPTNALWKTPCSLA